MIEFLRQHGVAEYVQQHLLTVYLVTISLVTFLGFGFDKMKARRGWWRTPERTLLRFCLLGGSPGGGLAMMVFRHKISKPAFRHAYFAIAGVQVVALAAWLVLKN